MNVIVKVLKKISRYILLAFVFAFFAFLAVFYVFYIVGDWIAKIIYAFIDFAFTD
jgi:hypothetical protein